MNKDYEYEFINENKLNNLKKIYTNDFSVESNISSEKINSTSYEVFELFLDSKYIRRNEVSNNEYTSKFNSTEKNNILNMIQRMRRDLNTIDEDWAFPKIVNTATMCLKNEISKIKKIINSKYPNIIFYLKNKDVILLSYIKLPKEIIEHINDYINCYYSE